MDLKLKKPTLPIKRICEVEERKDEEPWLIESLWPRRGVGICGGPPKCRKSWFGLDCALSIASGTSCLSHFKVSKAEPVIIYMAEDDILEVKKRIESICAFRNLKIDDLPLHIITSSQLFLDDPDHKTRLANTVESIKPSFLLLDPLVRLHRLDENSSRDISTILGFLRGIQREYELSIMLTHHANKKTHGRPGERMRGSSDIYAFCDSAAYLFPKSSYYELTVEHRSKPSIDPFLVDLNNDETQTCLQIISNSGSNSNEDINTKIIQYLKESEAPLTRTALRNKLSVKNSRLGLSLTALEKAGIILKNPQGLILNQKLSMDREQPEKKDSQ